MAVHRVDFSAEVEAFVKGDVFHLVKCCGADVGVDFVGWAGSLFRLGRRVRAYESVGELTLGSISFCTSRSWGLSHAPVVKMCLFSAPSILRLGMTFFGFLVNPPIKMGF